MSEGSDESSEDASRKPGAVHHHQQQQQQQQGRRSRDGRGGRGGGGGKSGGGSSIVEEAPAGNWSKAVSSKTSAAEKAPGKVGDRDRNADADPPPLPPGPPPPGTRTSMDGSGPFASPPPPLEQPRPSWGPKKTAPIDAIRAPPTPPPVPAEDPASPPREATRSRQQRPPTAAEGRAAAAKGRLGVAPKGSWSSSSPRGVHPAHPDPRREARRSVGRKLRVVGRESASAPPSPARPLAGAWAKGNGKDELGRRRRLPGRRRRRRRLPRWPRRLPRSRWRSWAVRMPPRVVKARKALRVDLARRRRRVIPTRARRKTRRNERRIRPRPRGTATTTRATRTRLRSFPRWVASGKAAAAAAAAARRLRLASRGVPARTRGQTAAGRRGYRRKVSPRRDAQALHACMIHS